MPHTPRCHAWTGLRPASFSRAEHCGPTAKRVRSTPQGPLRGPQPSARARHARRASAMIHARILDLSSARFCSARPGCGGKTGAKHPATPKQSRKMAAPSRAKRKRGPRPHQTKRTARGRGASGRGRRGGGTEVAFAGRGGWCAGSLGHAKHVHWRPAHQMTRPAPKFDGPGGWVGRV